MIVGWWVQLSRISERNGRWDYLILMPRHMRAESRQGSFQSPTSTVSKLGLLNVFATEQKFETLNSMYHARCASLGPPRSFVSMLVSGRRMGRSRPDRRG